MDKEFALGYAVSGITLKPEYQTVEIECGVFGGGKVRRAIAVKGVHPHKISRGDMICGHIGEIIGGVAFLDAMHFLKKK